MAGKRIAVYQLEIETMLEKVRYPEITVELVGRDGNAFAILGRVRSALREASVPEAEIQQFLAEATRGDYDNLLQTMMKWVDVA